MTLANREPMALRPLEAVAYTRITANHARRLRHARRAAILVTNVWATWSRPALRVRRSSLPCGHCRPDHDQATASRANPANLTWQAPLARSSEPQNLAENLLASSCVSDGVVHGWRPARDLAKRAIWSASTAHLTACCRFRYLPSERLLSACRVTLVKLLITHRKENDALNNTYDDWNVRPHEYQVHQAPTPTTKVELMRPDPPKQQREKPCRHPVLGLLVEAPQWLGAGAAPSQADTTLHAHDLLIIHWNTTTVAEVVLLPRWQSAVQACNRLWVYFFAAVCTEHQGSSHA